MLVSNQRIEFNDRSSDQKQFIEMSGEETVVKLILSYLQEDLTCI